ncbi:MAG TPA: hypothetical protein DDZ62_00090 [Delftia acidovorans]|nr:hypothetical protein [Delftia acidovorans]
MYMSRRKGSRRQEILASRGAGSFFMTVLKAMESHHARKNGGAEGVLFRKARGGCGLGAGRISAS